MHTKPLGHLAGTVCTDMSAHKDWSQNSVHSLRGITTGVKTGSTHAIIAFGSQLGAEL